jgi:hypothetical protein
MSGLRALVIVVSLAAVAAAASLPGCSAADHRLSGDRRGDVNGRSFELVSTRADGTEWSFRARGNSLWIGYVRDEDIGELGDIALDGPETARLWDLIDNVDVGGRARGKPDRKRGTLTLRLREPDGEGGHDLATVLVSRKTSDEDILNLSDYLIELARKHKHVEPSL